jgi:hypothetical protein
MTYHAPSLFDSLPATGADIVGPEWHPAAVSTVSEATARAVSLRLHRPDAVGTLADALAADGGDTVVALHGAARVAVFGGRPTTAGRNLTDAERAVVAAVREVRAVLARADRTTGRVSSWADAATVCRAVEHVDAAMLADAMAHGVDTVARRTAKRVPVSQRVEHVDGVGTIPAPLDGPTAGWLAARADRLGERFAVVAARSALRGMTSTGLDSRTGRYVTVKADRIESTTVAVVTGAGRGGWKDGKVRGFTVSPEVVARLQAGTATDEDRATIAAARAGAVTLNRTAGGRSRGAGDSRHTTGTTRKAYSRRRSFGETAVREWALSVGGVLDSITDAEVAALDAVNDERAAAAAAAGGKLTGGAERKFARQRAAILTGAVARLERVLQDTAPAEVHAAIAKGTRK